MNGSKNWWICCLVILSWVENYALPAFPLFHQTISKYFIFCPKGNSEETVTGQVAVGHPDWGEALSGTGLQTGLLLLSSLTPLFLEFSQPPLPILCTNAASFSDAAFILESCHPVSVLFVFLVILVRIGIFLDWQPKEKCAIWMLSYVTLLRTKGWTFRENLSALFFFKSIFSQFLQEFFFLLYNWDLRCTSAQAMPACSFNDKYRALQ